MKDRLDRTKVVLRHLPPAMSEAALMEQIDGRFSGRYNWVCFRPGKISQKNQRHARAYIDLKKAEDVLEFAEFFDGHRFVNEKGAQFKAVVEYAPSPRVPKQSSKKDGREGTILKDSEYLEFLELLAKPAENLLSAEIQLERKEAERAGARKENLIVTPLMDFVRQKRASKSESQRAISNRKLRSGVISTTGSSHSSKRSIEKRRGPILMYVSKDSTKNRSINDKSRYTLMSRKEQKIPDKHVTVVSALGAEAREDEDVTGMNGTISGVPVAVETGKKRVVLLTGKDRDNSHVSGSPEQQQSSTSSVRIASAAALLKPKNQQQASGRIIRSILSQKETMTGEKDKRPPRPPFSRPIVSIGSDTKRNVDDRATLNGHGSVSNIEKQDKRTRNKDRPDRGVWAPLRRSDASHSSEETHSSSSLAAQLSSDFSENGQVNFTLLENGSHKHVGQWGTGSLLKEADCSSSFVEGKPFKRGSPGYGSHERQMWVQKSGSTS